jgi:hypothetical protein
MKNTQIELTNLRLVKITSKKQKLKWNNIFRGSYQGGLRKAPKETFKDDVSQFFVVKSNNFELGFIRISNYSWRFSRVTNKPIWSASDAYVKPGYRSRGVLRFMLSEVVSKHSVVQAYLEETRLKQNIEYYKSLGFSRVIRGYQDGLVFVLQDEFAQSLRNYLIMQASNEEKYQIAA